MTFSNLEETQEQTCCMYFERNIQPIAKSCCRYVSQVLVHEIHGPRPPLSCACCFWMWQKFRTNFIWITPKQTPSFVVYESLGSSLKWATRRMMCLELNIGIVIQLWFLCDNNCIAMLRWLRNLAYLNMQHRSQWFVLSIWSFFHWLIGKLILVLLLLSNSAWSYIADIDGASQVGWIWWLFRILASNSDSDSDSGSGSNTNSTSLQEHTFNPITAHHKIPHSSWNF